MVAVVAILLIELAMIKALLQLELLLLHSMHRVLMTVMVRERSCSRMQIRTVWAVPAIALQEELANLVDATWRSSNIYPVTVLISVACKLSAEVVWLSKTAITASIASKALPISVTKGPRHGRKVCRVQVGTVVAVAAVALQEKFTH